MLETLDVYLRGIRGNPAGPLLTLKELAKGTPYSAEYLSLLARKGLIDVIKEGKTWKTTRKIIDAYIDNHPRR